MKAWVLMALAFGLALAEFAVVVCVLAFLPELVGTEAAMWTVVGFVIGYAVVTLMIFNYQWLRKRFGVEE